VIGEPPLDVGAVKLTVACALPAVAVPMVGAPGAVGRDTVTLKVVLAVLPALSIATHVTGVVPKGNVVPDAGEQTNPATPDVASVTLGAV